MGQVVYQGEDGRRSIWYARPAAHLLPYLTAYDAYDVTMAPGAAGDDVFPPAWAALRFTFTDEPWSLRLWRRRYEPMPRDALFGPTSHAGYSHFTRGHVVCVGLTPLGWARFVAQPAHRFADRVTPAEEVWPAAARLRAALAAGGDHAATFDAFFTDLLAETAPEDAMIAATMPLLLDPAIRSIAALAERLGLDDRQLSRRMPQHFGFTPKLLLRRARFMRALIEVVRTPRGAWAPLVTAAGYHDHSHFVRDCQLFLDMSLSAFLKRQMPLFAASLRLRAEVVGAPVQVLHPIGSVAA